MRTRYMLECRNEDGALLLYNTLNGEALRLTGNDLTAYEGMAAAGEVDGSPLGTQLLAKGFFSHDDVSSVRLIESLYMDTCHSHDVLELIVMPTEKCNFRCSYCYETFEHGAMSDELQRDLIQATKSRLKSYRGLKIQWFGGEPLLEIDIIERLSNELKRECLSQHKPFAAHITTNGYLLTLERYRRLRQCGVVDYQVTLDGLQLDHDEARHLASGEGTFATIVANLQAIKASESSRYVKFVLRTNLTGMNYRNYGSFLQFVTENFLGDNRFVLATKVAWNGSCDPSFVAFQGSESGMNLPYVRGLIQEANRHGNGRMLYDALLPTLRDATQRSSICYASKSNSLIVGSNGTLHKCTAHFVPENEVGHLGSGTFHLNAQYRTWTTRGYDAATLAKCSECALYPCCMGALCPHNLTGPGRIDYCRQTQEEALARLLILSYCDTGTPEWRVGNEC